MKALKCGMSNFPVSPSGAGLLYRDANRRLLEVLLATVFAPKKKLKESAVQKRIILLTKILASLQRRSYAMMHVVGSYAMMHVVG